MAHAPRELYAPGVVGGSLADESGCAHDLAEVTQAESRAGSPAGRDVRDLVFRDAHGPLPTGPVVRQRDLQGDLPRHQVAPRIP